MSWGGWTASGGSQTIPSSGAVGIGQAAGGRAEARRGLPARTIPACDSSGPTSSQEGCSQ